MKSIFLICISLFSLSLFSQDLKDEYSLIDSLTKKHYMAFEAKQTDSVVMLNVYGNQLNSSAIVLIWNEGKKYHLEYYILKKGEINKKKKVKFNELPLLKKLNAIKEIQATTLSQAISVRYPFHYKLYIKMGKDVMIDVFNTDTIINEKGAISSQLFKLLNNFLIDYKIRI